MNETKDETTRNGLPSGDPRSLGVDTRNGMEHKRVSYSSLLAASLVTSARCRWWRLRYRGAMPSGAINIADATWTLSGEGAATPGSLTAVVVVLLQGVGGRVRGMLVVRGVFVDLESGCNVNLLHLGLAMSTEFITVVYGRRTSCGTNPIRSSTATGG
jgi:hypothetical protein